MFKNTPEIKKTANKQNNYGNDFYNYSNSNSRFNNKKRTKKKNEYNNAIDYFLKAIPTRKIPAISWTVVDSEKLPEVFYPTILNIDKHVFQTVTSFNIVNKSLPVVTGPVIYPPIVLKQNENIKPFLTKKLMKN